MILKSALREYQENFRVALSFGLLLVFVPVLLLEFFQSQNIFFSSGSFFAEFALTSPTVMIPEIILVVFFYVLYSLFVSLMVFGVRKNLSKVRVEYYLSEMMKKFSTKIFIFFLASSTEAANFRRFVFFNNIIGKTAILKGLSSSLEYKLIILW